MAKQVEDVLTGGRNQDLALQLDGRWIEPKKEQALLAIEGKQPFVTSIVKGDQIVVLAVDSFQQPQASRSVKIRLPRRKHLRYRVIRNWPALYRGTMKKVKILKAKKLTYR